MENGVVRTASADKKITYGELIGGREFSPKLDPAAPTKDPRSFRIVGNSMPRLDIPAKVFGQFTYMQGFRVPRHVARAVARVRHADFRAWSTSGTQDIVSVERIVA